MMRSFVYVISAPNGLTKIGFARDPFARFTCIQTGSPLILTLEYICECPEAARIEKMMHKKLKPAHSHREWFNIPHHDAIAHIRAELARKWLISSAAHRIQRFKAQPIIRPKITEIVLHKRQKDKRPIEAYESESA